MHLDAGFFGVCVVRQVSRKTAATVITRSRLRSLTLRWYNEWIFLQPLHLSWLGISLALIIQRLLRRHGSLAFHPLSPSVIGIPSRTCGCRVPATFLLAPIRAFT
jgi:hypothetical protein